LLEFNGDMPDILYLDAARRDISMVVGDDKVALYTENFATLLEAALPAGQSIEFIRSVADEM
jgi:hypothetical protein